MPRSLKRAWQHSTQTNQPLAIPGRFNSAESLFRHAPERVRTDDTALLGFLEAEHQDCVARLAEALVIIAAALMAFGRLDVVDPVLSAPDLSSGIARLARAPWAFLPMTGDLRASRDTDRLRQ